MRRLLIRSERSLLISVGFKVRQVLLYKFTKVEIDFRLWSSTLRFLDGVASPPTSLLIVECPSAGRLTAVICIAQHVSFSQMLPFLTHTNCTTLFFLICFVLDNRLLTY